jgi:hypothetical protein
MHQMHDQSAYLDQILHAKYSSFSEEEHDPPTALNALNRIYFV